MYIGKKIKQLRNILGFNQDDMALQIGVSQSYYSSIERGKKPISNKLLQKIIHKWNINELYFESDKFDKFSTEKDIFMGGLNGGNIGGVDKHVSRGLNNLVEGVDYVVDKDGGWISKGSKLDKFIAQATNVAIIDNLVNEKATPKIVRLMKLEALLVKNDIIPKKPLLDDFNLILDALGEMQNKFLSDDNEEIISQQSIVNFEKATELLDNVFYKNFDLLFKEKSPQSKIQNIINYDDLLSYWAAGEHKNEW